MGYGKSRCWCVANQCNGAMRHTKTVWRHRQEDGEDVEDMRPEMDDDDEDGLVEDYYEDKDNDDGNDEHVNEDGDVEDADVEDDDVDTEDDDEDEEEDEADVSGPSMLV